jgi:hypothetical protein
MLAIAERVADARDLEWAHLASRYPELFDRNPSIVERYYSRAILASERARVSSHDADHK